MFHCARERETSRFGSARETSDTDDDDDDDDEVVPNYQMADKLLFYGSKRGEARMFGLPI